MKSSESADSRLGIAERTVRIFTPDSTTSGARSFIGVTRAKSAAGENGDDRALVTPSGSSP